MLRRVAPEILDSLSHDDPRALRLHRGIEYFNVLLGNYAWFERVLATVLQPGDRVLEVGAGQGRLLRGLATAFADRELTWAGLDLASPRPKGFSGAWIQESALTFEGYQDFDVVLANHLLHQFTDEQLRELGQKLALARVLVTSEPWRCGHAVWLARLSPLIGMPGLAVHDGVVSVRAGLRKGELPRLLGLEVGHWQIAETIQPLGAMRMLASKDRFQTCSGAGSNRSPGHTD